MQNSILSLTCKRNIHTELSSDLLGLDILHDADCLDDQLHSNWRPLESTHLNHVTFVEGLETGNSSILREGKGLEQGRNKEGRRRETSKLITTDLHK